MLSSLLHKKLPSKRDPPSSKFINALTASLPRTAATIITMAIIISRFTAIDIKPPFILDKFKIK